jgi:hypothetical protein
MTCKGSLCCYVWQLVDHLDVVFDSWKKCRKFYEQLDVCTQKPEIQCTVEKTGRSKNDTFKIEINGAAVPVYYWLPALIGCLTIMSAAVITLYWFFKKRGTINVPTLDGVDTHRLEMDSFENPSYTLDPIEQDMVQTYRRVREAVDAVDAADAVDSGTPV